MGLGVRLELSLSGSVGEGIPAHTEDPTDRSLRAAFPIGPEDSLFFLFGLVLLFAIEDRIGGHNSCNDTVGSHWRRARF